MAKSIVAQLITAQPITAQAIIPAQATHRPSVNADPIGLPSIGHPRPTLGPTPLGGVPVLKMTTASAMPRRPPPLGRTGHPTVTHTPLVHPLVPQPSSLDPMWFNPSPLTSHSRLSATTFHQTPLPLATAAHRPQPPIGHSHPPATAVHRPQPSIGHSRPSATAAHRPQPSIGHS